MLNNVKIGIIGGDARQSMIGKRLSEYGYEVAVWGVKDFSSGEAVRCVDWKSAVEKSRAVILPFPAFPDGKYIIESNGGAESITLSQIISSMAKDSILFAGRMDDVVIRTAEYHGIKTIDFFDDEILQIKNAVPTAEAAIEIALREMPITLYGARTVVCGYGRIGKILSRLLNSFGAKVYVSARNDADLACIEIDGNHAVRYGDQFLEIIEKTDVLFNTVPTKIIDNDIIEKMSACRLIIDLASKDGGVDFNAASEKGIKSIHALALPGKTAPVSAGEIIAECILNILIKQGVIPA